MKKNIETLKAEYMNAIMASLMAEVKADELDRARDNMNLTDEEFDRVCEEYEAADKEVTRLGQEEHKAEMALRKALGLYTW